MAKWYGKIGYAMSAETSPGVWTDEITEKTYYGDLVKDMTSKWNSNSDSINDTFVINDAISIVADPFTYQHFHCIKYAELHGQLWKVTSIEVKRPRLILSLGGEYHGE